MELFEELQSEWNNQSEITPPKNGSRRIKEKVSFLRKKQRIAYAVLSVTVLILIGFFFYISAYRYNQVMLLLLIMIVAILLRIAVEVASIQRLKKLDRTKNMELFTKNLLQYYTNRKKIHYVVTPILILAYCGGFIGLLPYFESALSDGFYTYIKISSVCLLIGLGCFIAIHIKKELRLLKELQGVHAEGNKKK